MCRTEPTAFGPNWTVFNLIAKLNSYDRPLKAEDVVDVFGFSKTKVYRMSEAKQIPSALLGGTWVYGHPP
jgi:hypothetical protein